MKAIIFDSGTLISFSMSGLIGELKKLKKIFDGKFLITREVKKEVIDKPLTIKRFELDALRIRQLLDEKILEMPSSLKINDGFVENKTREILGIANNTFISGGKPIHLIDVGEASCLVLSKILTDKKIENVIAIDERTTRMLVEKPENLIKLMESKLHMHLNSRKENYKHFNEFNFVRSTELVYVAYKKNLIDLKDGNAVLDALLYSLKFRGVAISDDEIREIKAMNR